MLPLLEHGVWMAESASWHFGLCRLHRRTLGAAPLLRQFLWRRRRKAVVGVVSLMAGNAGLANPQIFRFFTDSSRSRAKVSYER
jgi:hypothetical protein